jgi:pimeloyl-ACP methyl ester carboxylesterase
MLLPISRALQAGESIDSARPAVLEGVGHMPQLDQPELRLTAVAHLPA